MKVLVIGSGGREHAICGAFRKSPGVTQLFCANGNAGIAEIATCVPVRPDDIHSLADFAAANAIDLTFVGGETSLALGIVDEFDSRGLTIVGPCREAAKLEASKSFAKDFMARHAIPTAKFTTSHSPAFAILELESGDFGGPDTPVVVKADGLAAGKGVVVARNRAEALAAINEMASVVGTAAAEKIVLEECLVGKEVSLLMFVDGEDYALMPPVRDHKRIGEGDTGANTGGMGTFTDTSLLSDGELRAIKDTIIRPTLHGCIREGFRYRGIMFLGLMMVECTSPRVSKGGTSNVRSNTLADARALAPERTPMLLEYNVRFGDPETQAILLRLDTDLVEICEAMVGCGGPRVSKGDTFNVEVNALADAQAYATRLSDINIQWRPGCSACVVLAAEGYPAKPRTGDAIRGLEEAKAVPNVEIFHAGTARSDEGGASDSSLIPPPSSLVTAGGRVLGVTATGNDLAAALATAYSVVNTISFDGMQFRRDIGK